MSARSPRRHEKLKAERLPRVTYIVDTPGYGGAEVYVEHLLRGGGDRVRPALLVAAPGVPSLAAVARKIGAPVRTFKPGTRKLQLWRLMQLTLAVARTHADVVHVNMTTATNNRYAIAAAWLARVPVIATVHTPIALGRRPSSLLRWLFAQVFCVMAVSAEVAQLLVESLHVPPGRVRLIKNGVDVVPSIPARPPPPVSCVVSIGRLEFEKGFDLLVSALRLLVSRGTPVRLIVAGDGSEREALEQAAAGLPIQFCGFVRDTNAFWADADIFCLPSRYEGLPLALLEAMMRGLPCVATDVGDVAAALGSGGIIVPSDSAAALAGALAELVADPTRRVALGAAGRMRALATYSADSMVALTLDVSIEAATPHLRRVHGEILV